MRSLNLHQKQSEEEGKNETQSLNKRNHKDQRRNKYSAE